jgi:hypothetical protein
MCCSKCFICSRHTLQAFWSGCCTCFTHMLQEYIRNVSAILVLCCSACFHGVKLQVFYLILHMFHTYVISVCSKYFIHFIQMLHSNVLYYTCFILFGESVGAWSDDGMARAPKNGPRWAGGCWSGRDGGGVRVRDEAGDFESRRTGRATGRGESSRRVGAATGRVRVWGKNKNQHQHTGAGCTDVLSGRPGASLTRWGWFGGLRILVHT